MEDKIKELFDLLGLSVQNVNEMPRYIDTDTPFEKCGITVRIPTTISNSTTTKAKISPLIGTGVYRQQPRG
ncbi:MAG: hypothetical protein LBK56_01005 [Gracilibacteraceae bacterium]|jgi:hypothetical protein|nr:hypothetical protein [Gracilibacteraceae bacterium]